MVVALTGGIGSGKTTVADVFKQLGAGVVDTDEISHSLTGPDGGAIAAIGAAFGESAITSAGALDREKMRALVFAQPAAKSRLESILHPMIRDAVDGALADSRLHHPYTILVVPLLFESTSYRRRAQRTLAVDCPTALQLARVQKRSGLSAAETLRIMSAQVSRSCRLQMADDVVCNAADQAAIQSQVARLHARYAAMAAALR